MKGYKPIGTGRSGIYGKIHADNNKDRCEGVNPKNGERCLRWKKHYGSCHSLSLTKKYGILAFHPLDDSAQPRQVNATAKKRPP